MQILPSFMCLNICKKNYSWWKMSLYNKWNYSEQMPLNGQRFWINMNLTSLCWHISFDKIDHWILTMVDWFSNLIINDYVSSFNYITWHHARVSTQLLIWLLYRWSHTPTYLQRVSRSTAHWHPDLCRWLWWYYPGQLQNNQTGLWRLR